MKCLTGLSAALSLLIATSSAAQDYGQARTIKIRDNATACYDNGITEAEICRDGKLWNISQSELYIFPAEEARKTRTAVVICPGGGYGNVCLQKEGIEIARWFAAQGITAAVLK